MVILRWLPGRLLDVLLPDGGDDLGCLVAGYAGVGFRVGLDLLLVEQAGLLIGPETSGKPVIGFLVALQQLLLYLDCQQTLVRARRQLFGRPLNELGQFGATRKIQLIKVA